MRPGLRTSAAFSSGACIGSPGYCKMERHWLKPSSRFPGRCGDEDVLAIRFGVQSGTLAASLRGALEESSDQTPSGVPLFRWTLAYGGIISLLFFLISLFIYIKIIPAIQEICAEFDIEQSGPLRWSIRLAEVVSNYWYLFALLLLVFLWSLFSARPGRFVRRRIFGPLFGPLRQLHTAEVLRNSAPRPALADRSPAPSRRWPVTTSTPPRAASSCSSATRSSRAPTCGRA